MKKLTIKEVFQNRPNAIRNSYYEILKYHGQVETQFLGSTLEPKICEFMNEELSETPYSLITTHMIEELQDNGVNFEFDMSNCKVKGFSELKKLINGSFNYESAADFALVRKLGPQKFNVEDVASLKTSNSDSSTFIGYYNDPNGDVHDSIKNKTYGKTYGNIIQIVYSAKSSKVDVYHSNNKTGDFAKIFHKSSEASVGFCFHGNNLRTKKYGRFKSQLITFTERKEGSLKKDGTPKAQTSFNRGVNMHKSFLPYLAKRKIINHLTNIKIDVHEIKKQYLKDKFVTFL